MFPTAPTIFALTIALVVMAILTFGLSVLWGIFAATLAITTAVAIHRSIPRREK